ncbi:MAG TPA: PTS sugar transporter subunit IIA [Thermoanaerobaculia bacterium]|nr:PTS sugar transporter subunit IIA [Thermoanaerobaculia bacterium]
MVGKLILSHGALAGELLEAVARISGCPPRGFRALCLDWNEGIEGAVARVERAIAEVDEGDGVLILVDMYGGTPSNVAARFRNGTTVEVVSGVNLPMVLRLACEPAHFGSLRETAEWLRLKGQQSIVLAKGG